MNANITETEIPSPSPMISKAYELSIRCPHDGLPIIHLKGSSVCSCENGHRFDYQTMEPLK